ncbi:MAG: sigma-70 family RNA polymerase sigma factor [Clostridia bacterium]|nr:sigma-70 family RNA polymerase sigma factor [Clostridia bacterium]
MRKPEPPAPRSDAEIAALFRAGDESAAAEAEAKYGALLRRTAYGILRDEGESEECVNDLWLRLYQTPPDPPDGSKERRSLAPYLLAAVRNIAVNRWRAENTKKRIPDTHSQSLDELAEIIGTPRSAEDEFLQKELSRLINEFLRGLGKKDRLAFICRYYESLGLEEIGARLGVTKSAVYKMLERQKKQLKELLERNGFEV